MSNGNWIASGLNTKHPADLHKHHADCEAIVAKIPNLSVSERKAILSTVFDKSSTSEEAESAALEALIELRNRESQKGA